MDTEDTTISPACEDTSETLHPPEVAAKHRARAYDMLDLRCLMEEPGCDLSIEFPKIDIRVYRIEEEADWK